MIGAAFGWASFSDRRWPACSVTRPTGWGASPQMVVGLAAACFSLFDLCLAAAALPESLPREVRAERRARAGPAYSAWPRRCGIPHRTADPDLLSQHGGLVPTRADPGPAGTDPVQLR